MTAIRKPGMGPAMKAVAAALAISAASASLAQTPFSSVLSPLRDITAETKVVSRDMDALKKISAEFAQSYRFATSTAYYKEPGKFRVDSKAGAVTVRYVINGNTKTFKAGVINRKKDISKDPGQRQGAITLGLLTPDWARMVDAKYVGDKTIGGVKTAVYEARYKAEPKGGHYVLAMHPTLKYIVRYERYYSDGRLKNAMEFMEPKKFGDTWVPTRVKVYNAQGDLGAVTQMQNIKVNSGLADSLFAL